MTVEPRTVSSSTTSPVLAGTGHRADMADVAFLTGAAERMIELTVAVLLERGAIRADRDGELRIADRRAVRRTELEGLILAMVKAGARRTTAQLKQGLADHDVVLRTEISLVCKGLLRPWRMWSVVGLRRTAAGRAAVRAAMLTLSEAPLDSSAHVALFGLDVYAGPGAVPALRRRASSFGGDGGACGMGGCGSA